VIKHVSALMSYSLFYEASSGRSKWLCETTDLHVKAHHKGLQVLTLILADNGPLTVGLL
jgi:hypothetical protein